MLSPFIWTTMSVTKPTDVAFANPPVFAYRPTFDRLRRPVADHRLLPLPDQHPDRRRDQHGRRAGDRPALRRTRCRAIAGWCRLVLLVLALVFRALPRFAVVLPMYEITKAIGIYDTTYALAAALIAINQPFTIWLLRNFFAEIPNELDEAAMIDGCTRFGVLRRVMIPLMGPGILTAGIFVFLFAFQEYLTAPVLTDINAKTVPVFIATQLGQNLPMLQQAGGGGDAADPAGDRRSRSSPRSTWWPG